MGKDGLILLKYLRSDVRRVDGEYKAHLQLDDMAR
jgi:hypothetical protein